MGKRLRVEACLEYVREGNTLVVTRLDRLARSTLHLYQIAAELHRKQVHLQVFDQHIDTSDATGRLLFNMLEPLRSVRPSSVPSGRWMGFRGREHVGCLWVGKSA